METIKKGFLIFNLVVILSILLGVISLFAQVEDGYTSNERIVVPKLADWLDKDLPPDSIYLEKWGLYYWTNVDYCKNTDSLFNFLTMIDSIMYFYKNKWEGERDSMQVVVNDTQSVFASLTKGLSDLQRQLIILNTKWLDTIIKIITTLNPPVSKE